MDAGYEPLGPTAGIVERWRDARVASQERCKRLGTQAPVMLGGGGDSLGNHLLGG